MGHSISAVLSNGDFNEAARIRFDMKIIRLPQGITMVPLDACYCDHWSTALGITGQVSERPLLNACVIHHMIRAVVGDSCFAVIETDYFGGAGEQSAALYQSDVEIFSPEVGIVGPINKVLKQLGVYRAPLKDEFDTVGLSQFRSFSNMFKSYME